MANRRMFSLDVINTDKFLDMPVTAQCLYFHLGMRADDDGFISNPKQIIRLAACTQGDIKALIENGFVIPFESGVVVIRHWKQHNYIQSDRYRKTKYKEELSHLELRENVYKLDTETTQVVSKMEAQYRLSKDIVRDIVSIELGNTVCPEPDKPVSEPSGILLPLNDKSFYEVPKDKIELWVKTYPAVDVMQELGKMRAWLDSNPTRRKTRRGISRFINSWLSRKQDDGKEAAQNGRQGCRNNSFNSFRQNDYNIDELEKHILSN
ncbi:MAG: hypothetical protein K2P44_11545 [Lachnospiraceae bacterium]|nr:hypothetical protein [Lachnospiraceae bacterium]